MATITTTFFFITDTRATDRSQAATWTKPPVSSSLAQSWRWSK